MCNKSDILLAGVVIIALCSAEGTPGAFAASLPNRATVGEYEHAVDMGTWVRNALEERYAVIGQTFPTNPVSDSQQHYLQQLKNSTKSILSKYVNLDAMGPNGLAGWYFSDGTNGPTTLPMYTATGICASVGAPSNYFDYTPWRAGAEWGGETWPPASGAEYWCEYTHPSVEELPCINNDNCVGGYVCGQFHPRMCYQNTTKTSWYYCGTSPCIEPDYQWTGVCTTQYDCIEAGFTPADYGWKYMADIIKKLVAIPCAYPTYEFIRGASAEIANSTCNDGDCDGGTGAPSLSSLFVSGYNTRFEMDNETCYYAGYCTHDYWTNDYSPFGCVMYRVVGPSYSTWNDLADAEEAAVGEEYAVIINGLNTSYVARVTEALVFYANEIFQYDPNDHIYHEATYNSHNETTYDWYETYWDTNALNRTRSVFKYQTHAFYSTLGVSSSQFYTVNSGLPCPYPPTARNANSFKWEGFKLYDYVSCHGIADYSKHADGFTYK